MGKELERQNVHFRTSQKWFEMSSPNFHQLFNSIDTNFAPNLKALGSVIIKRSYKPFWTEKSRRFEFTVR